jgi:hypothetical protein
MGVIEGIWITDDEQKVLDEAIFNIPYIVCVTGGVFWFIHRLAQLQGDQLGLAKCNVWRLQCVLPVLALVAIATSRQP